MPALPRQRRLYSKKHDIAEDGVTGLLASVSRAR
jgi:hypothetical protein